MNTYRRSISNSTNPQTLDQMNISHAALQDKIFTCLKGKPDRKILFLKFIQIIQLHASNPSLVNELEKCKTEMEYYKKELETLQKNIKFHRMI